MTTEQSNIVYLVKKLRDDTTTLVRDEISLAKTEINEKIASTSRNVGYLAAGALVAYAAGILLLQGISLLLRDLFIWGGMNDKCEPARFSHCCGRNWPRRRSSDCQGVETR